MKKTVCDKCGTECIGRNPPGFHDILVMGNVYVDLCEDCYDEYYLMKNSFYKNADENFSKKVLDFLKNNGENS